ncbi:hypothetical protein [Acidovorax sp.]|uniref:hypothetical protein n=1 Tax=Acidovorax sp. TaxID=1872122 RepID=UPI00261ACF2A|nr:hypothetical protein [Acidovorax sp.]
MTETQAPVPQIPPEVLRYIKDPVEESRQFDFLIGDWGVDALRFREDGALLFKYRALWSAVALNGGRMIMDNFQALGPAGQAVSSFVTLRTYSEVTNRWELAGLQALQPSVPTEWHGVAKNGEMLLDAKAKTPTGDLVNTRIRFFNIRPESFSWESSTSLDDGKSWRKTAELTATRVAKG